MKTVLAERRRFTASQPLSLAVPHPTNYGVTNVVGLGAPEPLFLTSNGVYHNDAYTQSPRCGSLQ